MIRKLWKFKYLIKKFVKIINEFKQYKLIAFLELMKSIFLNFVL